MKLNLGGMAAAVLLAFPASAQDWAGNWFGLSLGYGSGTYVQGDFDIGELGVPVDVGGAMLALHYERNFQSGNRVFGFDADLSNGVSGATPIGTPAPDWSCELGDCVVDVKSMLTLRGRYGWVMSNSILAYGAAGLAAGKVEGGILNSATQGSSTAVGFTIGGGVSRMLGPNTMIFGEINHVDLGDLQFGSGDTSADTFDAKGDFSTIRIGASFRF